jgi:hypothetical protein
MLFLLV